MSIKTGPATIAFGRPTFWGTYIMYKDQLARNHGWNIDTATSYDQIYYDTIIPHLENHNRKPLDTYKREDFVKAIAAIKHKGYQVDGIRCEYEKETLDRFLRLIRIVVEIAASNYRCRNCFIDETSKKGSSHSKPRPMIIPKAMTIEQEVKTGQALLTDPMQSGEYMGLCAMYSLGLRNAEACALNYGDIRLWHDTPGLWVAWIYKTTIIDGNDEKSGGKTKNADRVVILPDLYVKLIFERKKRLQELLGNRYNIDDLPIACHSNTYDMRCKADDLTVAAKKLFCEVGIHPDQVQKAYEHYLQNMDETDPIKQILYADLEKDPTAYFLRRVAATAWIDVGLSEAQVEYMIGHDISNPSITRPDYMNTESLLEIHQIVNQRAVVNDGFFEKQNTVLNHNTGNPIHQAGQKTYHIPAGASQVSLQLTAREFFDFINLSISADSPVKISYQQFSAPHQDFSTQIDTLADYHSLYPNSYKY